LYDKEGDERNKFVLGVKNNECEKLEGEEEERKCVSVYKTHFSKKIIIPNLNTSEKQYPKFLSRDKNVILEGIKETLRGERNI
jgi:hypothetical protein